MSKAYPEHDKKEKHLTEIKAILEFIDTLDGDVRLRRERAHKAERELLFSNHSYQCTEIDYPLVSMPALERLVHEYFGIDFDALLAEREAIYQELVESQQESRH